MKEYTGVGIVGADRLSKKMTLYSCRLITVFVRHNTALHSE